MDRNTIKLFGLCFLLLFIITPVIAAPACSFCEFINISKGDPGTPGSVVTIGLGDKWYIDGIDTGVTAIGVDGAPGLPGGKGDTGPPGDTTGVPFLNGTREMLGNLSMGGFNISKVLNPVAAQDAATKNYVDAVNQSMLANVSLYGSGATVAYVDNVNASMRNNVSIYVTAVNQTQIVNMSLSNATMRTNVSWNNDTMRANVSTYVIAVNNTQIVNMSLSNATMKTYVDNVNTSMRANVSKAIAIEMNMSAMYPVGSVYITTLSTNPHDIFSGFGTWNSIGSGYVITGV